MILTEREISEICVRSIQRDIRKHLDRISELNEEYRYFMACIRDATPTNAEHIAMIEARMWWEDRNESANADL